MLPIVLGIVPTLVGSALLVGLKSIPKNRGALLFGTRLSIKTMLNAADKNWVCRKLYRQLLR